MHVAFLANATATPDAGIEVEFNAEVRRTQLLNTQTVN